MFCLRWFEFRVSVPIHNIWTTTQANFVCLHWIVPGNRLAVCTHASICLSISAYLKSGGVSTHEQIRGGTHTHQSTQTKIGGRVLFQASAVIIPVNVAYYMYRKHYYKVIQRGCDGCVLPLILGTWWNGCTEKSPETSSSALITYTFQRRAFPVLLIKVRIPFMYLPSAGSALHI